MVQNNWNPVEYFISTLDQGKKLFETSGEKALQMISLQKLVLKNRVPAKTRKVVVKMAIEGNI